jgi:type II secretory pathway pseudopilin PulG
MNKRALTLVEIIVSTVILALVMTGLVNVFVAGRKFALHNRNRTGAGEIGRIFIDPLQNYVRQDTWSSNPLGTNSYPNAGSGIYTAAYTITNHPSNVDIKRVRTRITWTE